LLLYLFWFTRSLIEIESPTARRHRAHLLRHLHLRLCGLIGYAMLRGRLPVASRSSHPHVFVVGSSSPSQIRTPPLTSSIIAPPRAYSVRITDYARSTRLRRCASPSTTRVFSEQQGCCCTAVPSAGSSAALPLVTRPLGRSSGAQASHPAPTIGHPAATRRCIFTAADNVVDSVHAVLLDHVCDNVHDYVTVCIARLVFVKLFEFFADIERYHRRATLRQDRCLLAASSARTARFRVLASATTLLLLRPAQPRRQRRLRQLRAASAPSSPPLCAPPPSPRHPLQVPQTLAHGWGPLPCAPGTGNTGACFRPRRVAGSGKPS